MKLPTPTLEHTCDLNINLAPIKEIGMGRGGKRRIIPIIGGTVTGPLIFGKVLSVGADWQTVFNDGLTELDTRYAIETDDGAIIEVVNYGYRHGPDDVIDVIARGEKVAPESYYMKTQARLETGAPAYDWVNRTLFTGVGHREASSVIISLYAIR